MEGSENILETIYEEEETFEDVDMIDAESLEEGELQDDDDDDDKSKQGNNKVFNTETENPKPKSKRKKKNKRNKKKPRPASTITDVNRFVLDTCRRLKEKKSYLVWNAVGCLGVAAFSDLVNEVDAIQACGGQMTADGKRFRNGGGILWNILKTREPRAYKEIMTKGKELEKQFRKPNFRHGPTQAKEIPNSERKADAPFQPILAHDLDGSQCISQSLDELQLPCDNGKRVSALSRIRVPVAYDDLVAEDVKDE